MSNDISVVYKTCKECYDSVEGFSSCCGEEVFNGKCAQCGKFCKSEPCTECGGYGTEEARVGDEVSVYVYTNSDKYLKDQFKIIFKNGKFYNGKIKSIINKEMVEVKLSTKAIKVKVDDIFIN